MNRTKRRRRTTAQNKNKNNPAQLGLLQATDVIESAPSTSSHSVERKSSEESVVYVGTTFLSCSDMPANDTIIDLTKSDTTLTSSWDCTYNVDNYDISGDNIIDEIRLKDRASSSASVFTIFPPKPSCLFATHSEEMCVFRVAETSAKSTQKRTLSLTDITCYTENNSRVKRRAINRCRLDAIDRDSTDFVWKLKKSYPLSNGLCLLNTEDASRRIAVGLNSASDVDLFEIVDGVQGEVNISSSEHHQPLVEDLREHLQTMTTNGDSGSVSGV